MGRFARFISPTRRSDIYVGARKGAVKGPATSIFTVNLLYSLLGTAQSQKSLDCGQRRDQQITGR